MKRLLLIGLSVAAPLASADVLRDPTRPPAPVRAEGSAVESGPVLSAIFGPRFDRVAIFNGKLVRGGESVGPYQIDVVFEDGVRYRRAGVSRELHLPHSEGFKKPSTAAARAPLGER
jgi:hypothetical protein